MDFQDQPIELTREELYAQVWADPMTKVAERYGLSDRGLAKICERMGIPVPGRGYWAQRQVVGVSLQPKLPMIKPGQQYDHRCGDIRRDKYKLKSDATVLLNEGYERIINLRR